MKREDAKRAKNEQQQSAVAGWDNEGGARPSGRQHEAETRNERSHERAARRAAFDTTYDSSARGEHRYPDTHQTDAEQKARHDRDVLKRELEGTN